eukprot:TRINITY_DN5801_c0_g1_i3.p1 TRINITY_DN5801_c0_g1~~TRINITY_DN5801_c0_g1_i3.p1  ORF type:complete len:303 (+),score=105.23 TRINITY_DN5801_c0_g1_i3:87-995(+)
MTEKLDFVGVVESAEFISANSKDVKICHDGMDDAAKELCKAYKTGEFRLENWKKHELNPTIEEESTLDWIFLVDTLNFCFWNPPGNPLYSINYRGKNWTGYWTLPASIDLALEEGIPVTSAQWMSQCNDQSILRLFKSDENGTDVPQLSLRLQVINETGKVLLERFGGKFSNCVKEAGKSAQKLLRLIVDNFPSYRDEALFHGKRVCLYKRAQILIGDIWACFEGRKWGEFEDIDSLTMFADYRVPQILVAFNLISYSESLLQYLKEGKLLSSGDAREVEIRGNSILAVEVRKKNLFSISSF